MSWSITCARNCPSGCRIVRRSGLIDETLFLQGHWYNVIPYWKLLMPSILAGRKSRTYIFENFELLASRAQAWLDRHPRGNYPANARRMVGEDTSKIAPSVLLTKPLP